MDAIPLLRSPLNIPIDSSAEPNVTVPVLREGEKVNLTCTAPAPCPSHPPNVKWAPALGGDVTQRTQMNADGTQSVSECFVPSFHHHELKVNCVSIHPLHREDKPLLSHKTVILSVECEILTQQFVALFNCCSENTHFFFPFRPTDPPKKRSSDLVIMWPSPVKVMPTLLRSTSGS